MPSEPKYPVENPTWFGTIRYMFNEMDIEKMRGQGLDLASYDAVRNAAVSIYQRISKAKDDKHLMPPRNHGGPWAKAKIDTFVNWMKHKYPMGSPRLTEEELSLTASNRRASRVRKDIESLSQGEVALLKRAFEGIIAKDTEDPNSYFVQAGYHGVPGHRYCQHNVPGYNPWHRAYLYSFEQALRSVSGCEGVTLPYWDITKPFPALLRKAPFDKYVFPAKYRGDWGKETERFSPREIENNLKQYEVAKWIGKAMKRGFWGAFHGGWKPYPRETIIRAHDGGHGAIGPTMQNPSYAAYDPAFWFFHANWDRLWWKWQKKVGATTQNGLISTIEKDKDQGSYDLFTEEFLYPLEPFTKLPINLDIPKIIDSAGSLDVDYDAPIGETEVLGFAPHASRQETLDRSVFVDPQRATVTVDGINRLKIPGSFSVHLLKDEQRLASGFWFQGTEVEECETCVENPIAYFDFDLPLEQVAGGKLSVRIEPVEENLPEGSLSLKALGNPTISVHLPVMTD